MSRLVNQGSSLLILSYSFTASVNASTSCSSRVTPRALISFASLLSPNAGYCSSYLTTAC